MRSTGTKSSLIKYLLEETKIVPLHEIPRDKSKTAVIVDAMHDIRRWSFNKGEPFPNIADRYLKQLMKEKPENTTAIHFCCDRYKDSSLKTSERTSRRGNQQGKGTAFEVGEKFKNPEPNEFFHVSTNKARLQVYLCERWSALRKDTLKLIGNLKFYIDGGFEVETRAVLINEGKVTEVPQLQSTQEEADTRIILHSIYSASYDDVDRIVVQ